jgi:hypothetical protein
MNRFYTRFAQGVAIVSLLAACGGTAPSAPPANNKTGSNEAGSSDAPVAKTNTLTAIKADAVSLDPAAGYWANAPMLTLQTNSPVEKEKQGPAVSVQAVYDDTSIAMRFEWADASETLLKGAWTWDGTTFTKGGEEDRVQLFWPIGNNPEFSSKGCSGACHNMDPDKEKWWMGSENADLRYDLWHWKSARTNPAGQADDQWVGALKDPADVESSRYGDEKASGGYKDNVNEAGDGPAFMHSSNLESQIIMAGEETAIDPTKLTNGMIVPGVLVSPAVGSRGDVNANGKWENGKWVVVLMRSLDTSHDDDVSLIPPKPYPFGLAVTDNGGGMSHTVAPDVLTLEWQ